MYAGATKSLFFGQPTHSLQKSSKYYNSTMKKVSDAVQHSLLADDVALLALQRGVLNMSAYAEQIHAHIERTTMKPVKKRHYRGGFGQIST